MKKSAYGNVIRFWFVAAVLLTICAASKTVHAAGAGRTIWQSRDQFVTVERQDSVTDGQVAVNDHPFDLSLDRLTSILASINVRTADSEKPGPLFTATAVQTLATYLQKGLLQASPTEDVTFAVFGLHDTLYGFARSPKVTTGRIFYKAGKLNLIVGLVQQDVNERDDRRLSPFTPGSRQKVSSGQWTLLTDAPLVRRDWIVFGGEWRPAVIPLSAIEVKHPSVQAAPVQPAKRNHDTRSPAERLTTLNELKNKGLINEEEYRVKRLQVLDGL